MHASSAQHEKSADGWVNIRISKHAYEILVRLRGFIEFKEGRRLSLSQTLDYVLDQIDVMPVEQSMGMRVNDIKLRKNS